MLIIFISLIIGLCVDDGLDKLKVSDLKERLSRVGEKVGGETRVSY